MISRVPVDDGALSKFSPRLQQVALLVAQGLSNREIAAELGISVYTVRNEVSSILRKLNVRTRHHIAFVVRKSALWAGR